MSPCVASQRRRCKIAADALVDRDDVVAVDVTQRDDGDSLWSLEVTCEAPTAPPAVLGTLAEQSLSMHMCRPRGRYCKVVAVA